MAQEASLQIKYQIGLAFLVILAMTFIVLIGVTAAGHIGGGSKESIVVTP